MPGHLESRKLRGTPTALRHFSVVIRLRRRCWRLVLNVRTSCSDGGLSHHAAAQPERKGDDMKPSTKDQVEGKFHEMKGKLKEKTGQATKNPDLMDEEIGR